jgi:hypothetical protein
LHSEGLLQHHERELRLQSAEYAWSAVGMRGNRHMQEIAPVHHHTLLWLRLQTVVGADED